MSDALYIFFAYTAAVKKKKSRCNDCGAIKKGCISLFLKYMSGMLKLVGQTLKGMADRT